jgi:SAM-dependent methyltransferase
MSAFVTDGSTNGNVPADAALALTGERTVPGIAEENYWFRRHEVVYKHLRGECAGRDVLDVRHGNLAALPLPDASVDVVVNFQVIEHLWNQPQFIAECARVLRPAGLLMISTPNRITFSPGRDTPVNPFHTRELNAAELCDLLCGGGFEVRTIGGVFHGPRLSALDAKHGGSIIDAQIDRALADEPWPAELLSDVESVTVYDFQILDTSARDIDESLDLVAIAVRT